MDSYSFLHSPFAPNIRDRQIRWVKYTRVPCTSETHAHMLRERQRGNVAFLFEPNPADNDEGSGLEYGPQVQKQSQPPSLIRPGVVYHLNVHLPAMFVMFSVQFLYS